MSTQSQISTETPFDACMPSDLTLLHLRVAVSQEGQFKTTRNELGIAFIHTHSTHQEPGGAGPRQAQSACPSPPTPQSSPCLRARTSQVPRLCSVEEHTPLSRRRVTDGAGPEKVRGLTGDTRWDTTMGHAEQRGGGRAAGPASSTATPQTHLSPHLLFLNSHSARPPPLPPQPQSKAALPLRARPSPPRNIPARSPPCPLPGPTELRARGKKSRSYRGARPGPGPAGGARTRGCSGARGLHCEAATAEPAGHPAGRSRGRGRGPAPTWAMSPALGAGPGRL